MTIQKPTDTEYIELLPLHLTVYPKDQQQIQQISFCVPEGIERLEVRYRYSPGNTVDLGMMANGTVHGWSGGARDAVRLSECYATPGYQRSAIAPGNWHILLGLHHVTNTCDIHVDITFHKKHWRWFKGDTHIHSLHSDGKLSVGELVERAQAYGYHYLFFTDHNTCSQNREISAINSELCLIPGMELTTARGHVNLVGCDRPVQNFIPCDSESAVFARIHEARQNGARIGINHPFCQHCPWLSEIKEFDWLEIWNGEWDSCTQNEQAFQFWYQQLCDGKFCVAVAGSDFHREKGLALAHTWVRAECCEREAILSALQAGRAWFQCDDTVLEEFSVSGAGIGESTSGRQLVVKLKTEPANEILLYSSRGITTLESDNGNLCWSGDCEAEDFVFLRINREGHARLITNPVWLR